MPEVSRPNQTARAAGTIRGIPHSISEWGLDERVEEPVAPTLVIA